jgi:WD40 repeat protein/serine/threonine protein kinase
MGDSLNKAKAIFLAAIEKHSPEQWPAFLDDACAGDVPLRNRVEQLLRARAQLGSFHEAPEQAVVATLDVPTPEGPGTAIGPYRLLEQIGEGGFGVVFMAEQQQPFRRKVALKVLKPGMDTRQIVARFEAERQALALMDHPNIAKILDAGTVGPVSRTGPDTLSGTAEGLVRETGPTGRPYFVMELVRGIPITQFCDANRMAPRQRLELFAVVCQAVQHAHQKGIIHRDLKPSNVLVTLHDGTPVVKVIDFGIAKALGQSLTDKTLFTGFVQMIGTPLYMSPEQAEMSGLDVDTRSDIYSLGVLLYELLTGTPPLDQERMRQVGYDEMRRLIREEEPPRPSTRISTLGESAVTVSANRQTDPKQLSRFLKGELDWIVMKALEKDRSRRYETASALAADVKHYLTDEPVEACPPSTLYRFRKFAQRRKGVLMTATVVAAAVLVAVAGLAVSTTLTLRSNQELHLALDREQDTLERERQNAYYQRIALAEREWTANNLSRYDRLLDECPENLRGWEWHYLKRKRYNTLAPLRHDAAVLCAAISPDGRRIASGSQDGVVKIWDSQTGRNLASFAAHQDHVRRVGFSPDGRRLATASWDKSVKIWDMQALDQDRSAAPLLTLKHAGAVSSVVFSPDGQRLASGGGREVKGAGEVRLWDATTGTPVGALAGHSGGVYGVAFSPDGQRLASANADKTIRIWNAHTGQEQLTFRGHTQPVWCVAFSPDGRRLASGSGDTDGTVGELKIWDAQTGQEEFTLRGHTMVVFCVAFSPDGKRLASGSRDQTVKLWDVTTGQEALTLHGHLSNVRTVMFSPDGRRMISACHDGRIRIWDATPNSDAKDMDALTLRGDGQPVNSVAFGPADRRLLASAHQDGTIRLWDAATGKPRATLQADTHGVNAVAFSPDGQYLAAAILTGIVKIWDTRTWMEVLALSLPTRQRPMSITFSRDGRYLAVAGYDFLVTIFEVAGGKKTHELRAHNWVIFGLAYSPDGQVIASASADGTIRLWDVTTGQETANSPLRQAEHVLGVTFRPDGRRLISAGWDRTIRSWDTTTWKQRHLLRDPTGGPSSVAFSPDGRRLAWGGTDATVKVWDEATDEIHILRGHTSWVWCVTFSPDGKQIASASADGTVRIWKAPPVAESPHGEARNQEP